MPGTIEQVYDSLLADADASWELGLMEAAYHALAGALHCAEALRDESRVKHIRSQAERLRTHIDVDQPDHRLATASARDRGQRSVFATLAGQADAIMARLHATQATDHARAINRRKFAEPENDHGAPPPVSKEG
jgi:hypothetical protein